MIKKAKKYFLLILFVSVVSSLSNCKKQSDAIPATYVDFMVYLTQPQYVSLNAVGGWVYLTGGVKGIIVFRKSPTEFAAYERDCPYDPNAANARIDVDNSGVIGVDSNCGSKFSLADNSIVNGPTTHSMRAYYADYNSSSQTIHVHS